MTPSPARATCAACLRAACICHWVAPVASLVELLILQHPLEVRNAKNSARLLHLCLPGSRLVVGETFDADALAALLHADGRTPLLLYPGAPGPAAPAAHAPQSLRLVLLDATWRKSRKMLHLNPILHTLPRLALPAPLAGSPARYRIRKAHAPDQLSTLEAAALALGQVDADPARYAPLLAAFDGFVDQQAAFDPSR